MKLSFVVDEMTPEMNQEFLDRMIGREIQFLDRPATVTKAWIERNMLAIELDVPGLQVSKLPAPPLNVSLAPPEITSDQPRWMKDPR